MIQLVKDQKTLHHYKLTFCSINTFNNKITKMKKNIGTPLMVIGLMFTTLGLTILNDNKILQYSALILGVALTSYSVFVSNKWKKSQKNLKNKND